MFLKNIKDKLRKKGFKKGLFQETNSRTVSEDFSVPSRMPYLTDLGGVSPLDYTIMEGMEHLPRVISEMADEMLGNIEFDRFNDGSFLDEYIDLYVGLARNDLKRQRIHHGHVIEGLKIIEESRTLHDQKIREMAERTLKKYQEEKI